MSSGERPIAAAKGKQSDTEASGSISRTLYRALCDSLRVDTCAIFPRDTSDETPFSFIKDFPQGAPAKPAVTRQPLAVLISECW